MSAVGPALRRLRSLVHSMGAEMEVAWPRGMLDIDVRPPPGMVFDGSLHVVIGHQLPGRSVEDVCTDVMSRIDSPISCDVPNCEECE